jgi:hypothetical protein
MTTRSNEQQTQDEAEAIRIRAEIAADLSRVLAMYQAALTTAAGGRQRFALLAIWDATAAVLETVTKHVQLQEPQLAEANGPALAARLDAVLYPMRRKH